VITKILLILILLIPVMSYSDYITPSKEDIAVQQLIERAHYWVKVLEMKAPPYRWGKEGIEGGDCSGQYHWIMKKAGAPFPRSTAFAMYHGAWPGFNRSTWQDASFPDGIYFSWKKPADHVGIVDYKVDSNEQLDFVESARGPGKFRRTSFKKNSVIDKKFLGVRVLDLSSILP